MEMFERAFSVFAPFGRPGEGPEPPRPQSGPANDDLDDLKRQLSEMQKRLDSMSDKDE
jgi:polyhydroxyalkanoate synthesis regulator protein